MENLRYTTFKCIYVSMQAVYWLSNHNCSKSCFPLLSVSVLFLASFPWSVIINKCILNHKWIVALLLKCRVLQWKMSWCSFSSGEQSVRIPLRADYHPRGPAGNSCGELGTEPEFQWCPKQHWTDCCFTLICFKCKSASGLFAFKRKNGLQSIRR